MREGRLLLWEEDLEGLRRGPARGAGGEGREVPQQTPTGGTVFSASTVLADSTIRLTNHSDDGFWEEDGFCEDDGFY